MMDCLVVLREQGFQCGQCGEAFGIQKDLDMHLVLHIKLHPCTMCGDDFDSLDMLLKHMMWHAELVDHWCELCGVLFGQAAHLDRHMHTKHGPGTAEESEILTQSQIAGGLL